MVLQMLSVIFSQCLGVLIALFWEVLLLDGPLGPGEQLSEIKDEAQRIHSQENGFWVAFHVGLSLVLFSRRPLSAAHASRPPQRVT